MIKKSILIWSSIIPLAILNGILRDKIIAPIIGEKYALPLSGATLCLLILLIARIFIPRLGKGNKQMHLKIGLLWVLLTVLFEFGMGLLQKKPFSEMLNAYDVTTGNMWLIVVLFVGIAPFLATKIKNRRT